MVDINTDIWKEQDSLNNNALVMPGFPEFGSAAMLNDGMRAVVGGVKRWSNRIQATQTSSSTVINSYTLNYENGPAELKLGDIFTFSCHETNTAAATLAINSLAPVPIHIGTSPLAGGELVINNIFMLCYDGSVFRILNPAPGILRDAYIKGDMYVNGSGNIAGSLGVGGGLTTTAGHIANGGITCHVQMLSIGPIVGQAGLSIVGNASISGTLNTGGAVVVPSITATGEAAVGGGLTVTGSILSGGRVTSTEAIFPKQGDNQFYLNQVSNVPVINFNTNTYMQYDRGPNQRFAFVNNAVSKLEIDTQVTVVTNLLVEGAISKIQGNAEFGLLIDGSGNPRINFAPSTYIRFLPAGSPVPCFEMYVNGIQVGHWP